MRSIVISYILLISLALFFYRIIKKITIEEGLAYAVISIISIIYIAGLLGNTLYAIYLICILAGCGIILHIIHLYKDYQLFGIKIAIKNTCSFFSPTMFVLTVAIIFVTVAFKNTEFYNWDEYAQWGKAVKFMYENNMLPQGETFSGETEILSSTTFFHYFIMKFGGFKEYIAYVSNFILWFSGAILPLSGSKWRDIKKVAGYSVLIILAMNISFVQPYYNIYCDQPVAIWTGAVVAWAILHLNIKNIQFPILCIMNIALMKNMVGPLFACIISLACLIILFLNYSRDNDIKIQWKIECKKMKNWFLVLLFGCAPFTYTLIWSKVSSTNALLRGLENISFSSKISERLGKTLKACIGRCFQSVTVDDTIPFLTYAGFFCISLIIIILLTYYLKNEHLKFKVRILGGVYLLGFVLYWCVLFYAYMTIFPYTDAIKATSMNRYLSDYIMLGLPVLLCLFFLPNDFGEGKCHKAKILRNTFFIMLLFYLLLGINNDFINRITVWNRSEDKYYQEVLKVRDACKKLKKVVGDDKVLLICQNSVATVDMVIADYMLENSWGRHMGGYYFIEDLAQRKETAGAASYNIKYLQEKIEEEDFQYIWVCLSDDYLREYMDYLFNVYSLNDGDLYKVGYKDGRMKMEFIQNIELK